MTQKGLRIIALVVFLMILAGLLTGCRSTLTWKEDPVTEFDQEVTTIPDSPTREESSPTAAATEDVSAMEELRITIVYDNYPYQAGLGTEWGFSAYITYKDQNLLFDSGGSGALLLSNLEALDIEPRQIENVLLSHEHGDHTGGLQYLLSAGAEPNLFIPPSFSTGIKDQFRNQTQMVEVISGMEITEGMYSTGEMVGPPPEQGLVIDTAEGLVVVTGCAHPGIDRIIMEVKRQFEKEIYLVLGGFHLGNASDARLNQIIDLLQEEGVKRIAPSHCTGDHAIAMFRDAYGEDFIPIGAGAEIVIEG
jgi:7,8-dihydropterin-6-yl-methyl-4-(beta-D-ribofuranosyl)aminobenzene 5'-phosphate synthase